jgi:hypothetical protein
MDTNSIKNRAINFALKEHIALPRIIKDIASYYGIDNVRHVGEDNRFLTRYNVFKTYNQRFFNIVIYSLCVLRREYCLWQELSVLTALTPRNRSRSETKSGTFPVCMLMLLSSTYTLYGWPHTEELF